MNSPFKNISSRMAVGVVLIVLGLGFFAQQMDFFPFAEILNTWWPLVFIFVGFLQLFGTPQKLTHGLVAITLGAVMIADRLIPEMNFWATFVPLILIVIGISFLLRPKNDITQEYESRVDYTDGGENDDASHSSARHSDDENINVMAFFSGSEQRLMSRKFRGGKVSSIFGGVELDLRNAEMATSEASIDVDCTFGGVEIKVPPHWSVVIKGTPIFGGISNDTFLRSQDHSANSSPRVLTIRAVCMFGGIQIAN